jgi:hypothetical protein
MELHAVEAALLVRHPGDRAGVGGSHELEPGRKLGHLVAVAHPHLEHPVSFGRAVVLDALEQPRVSARAHLGVAEFPDLPRLDAAAELLRHGLHAVADAEHRHSELEHRARRPAGRFLVGRHVAARQDHAARAEAAHEIVGHVVRVDLAVDLRFPDPPRDELGVLRAEVEDQDLFMHRFIPRGSSGLP